MNDNEAVLVEAIQEIIEKPGPSYLKALRIVKDILVPAIEQVAEEFRMLAQELRAG